MAFSMDVSGGKTGILMNSGYLRSFDGLFLSLSRCLSGETLPAKYFPDVRQLAHIKSAVRRNAEGGKERR